MNFSKPINVIALGSVLLGVFILLVLILIQAFSTVSFGNAVFLFVPLLSAVFSFFIFWFIVERFINSKIKVIYRIISTKKITNDSPRQFKITEDVLSKITEDTIDWATQQSKQIKELEEQAAFRKEFLGNLAHELKTPVFSIQ